MFILLNIYEHSDTISKSGRKDVRINRYPFLPAEKEVLMDNIRIPVPAVDFHPPVYYCRRAGTALQPDGNLDKDFWADAPFTDEFIDIQGSAYTRPRFRTRVKMLWDDENLYIGAQLYGDEIWGNVTGR